MDNNKKYFDSPEFGRLLQRYERSLQMGKDEYFESDELSDIAEYYYDKKDKPRAEYVLDYAMRLHPGAVLPLVFKARIALIDEKDIEKARYYASLISDAYDIDCLYLKAEILIAEDKPEEANSFLRNAMDNIDEDDVPDFVLDVATIFIDYGLPDISAEWLLRGEGEMYKSNSCSPQFEASITPSQDESIWKAKYEAIKECYDILASTIGGLSKRNVNVG